MNICVCKKKKKTAEHWDINKKVKLISHYGNFGQKKKKCGKYNKHSFLQKCIGLKKKQTLLH